MELYEKTISSETVFKGNIVELRVDRIELPDGRPARREVIAHPGGVAILPYHGERITGSAPGGSWRRRPA